MTDNHYMMSPGINGGRGGSHHTGTVPKVKYLNHNEVVHDDLARHHALGGATHSSGTFLCSTSSNHYAVAPTLQRRDFGFNHMNNNLGLSMDCQPALSDAPPQQAGGQQGSSRIRKESNTSSATSIYEVPIPDVGSSNSNGGGSMSSSATAGGAGIGTGVVMPTIENVSPSIFYDVSLHNSNHTGSDNDEVNQSRWDQEGSISGNSSIGRRQKSNNLSEQGQVASRLNQIRDYIGQTTSVMERLQAAGTPQHIEQWLRLHDMLDGLRDSERKLNAIQNTFLRLEALENIGNDDNIVDDEDENETGEDSNVDGGSGQAESVPKSTDAMTRRNELKVKVEESQRKLIELREQQTALLALKQKAQEQLKEARAAQGALLASQEQRDDSNTVQDCNQLEDRIQYLHQFYEARNELAQVMGGMGGGDSAIGEVVQLQNKLEELQTKKMQIDQMVARFDASSNLFPNGQVVSGNNEFVVNNNTATNCGGNYIDTNISSNNQNNCNSNHNNSNSITSYNNSEGQSTEDKIAELAALKEQLARMQNALLNLSSSKSNVAPASSHASLSSNTACHGITVLHNSNAQESDGGFEDDNKELFNLNSSSCNFKQDNRAQAISQNHHRQPIQQQQTLSANTAPIPLPPVGGSSDIERSITPTAVVQQQLQAKSLKLQEAKARLHHLQELLRLVEELREAGKPVPERLLLLLNSPNGPLSSDDNLDLEQPIHQLQNQQMRSSSSSSSSSLISLFQPQNNNGNSGSVDMVSVSNSTSTLVNRDRDTSSVLQASNRSLDVNSTQKLYYQTAPPALNVTPSQSHAQRQQQQQPLHLPQQPTITIAKQKNNPTKRLCPKTQDFEEWMKKDDDPTSSVNVDVHSQQQQVISGYNSSGFQAYQDLSTASALWGTRSLDYSSDDGGRSEDDHENNEFCDRKAPPLLISGNGFNSAIANGAVGGAGIGIVGSASVSSPAVGLSAPTSSVSSKDQVPTTACSGPTNYANLSREMSAEGLATNAGNASSVSGAGSGVGLQNCNSSLTINSLPSNVWRKCSIGSGSPLPTCPVNNKGGVIPSHSLLTPTCYCCYNRQDGNFFNGDDRLVNSNMQQPNDNNTNWILHQISQLQAQLQHLCQTTASNKCNNQGGLLMASPHNMWVPPPTVAPPFFQQHISPSVSPSLHTPPIGVTSGGLTHYFGPQKHHYKQLLLNSLNQCCQLIKHQQCELATLKEALHDIQQQQHYSQAHGLNHQHQIQTSPHCAGDGNNLVMDDGSRSNLTRYIQSQPLHGNRLVSDTSLSGLPSSPHPPLVSLPPPHYFCSSYGNNLNLSFQPFRHPNPVGSFMSSSAGTLNNQVPPGNRANNYWDNFRSYSRQNLLSARSKCNEGRSASTGPASADCNSIPNERFRSGSAGNSSHDTREMPLPYSGTSGNIAASVQTAVNSPQLFNRAMRGIPVGNATSVTGLPPPQLQQQINTLNPNVNSAPPDVMNTHSIPSHKEKLNIYQHHLPVISMSSCINNNQNATSSATARLVSQSSVLVDSLQQQRPKQSLISVVSGSPKPLTRDNSSSNKCDTSKGASKKSSRLKEQPHGSENRYACSLSEQLSSSNGTNNNQPSIYFNNNTSSSTSRLLNCNNSTIPSGSGGLEECNSFELNTINNRQPQQSGIIWGNVTSADDLPRNSNCKRRLLMSTSTSAVMPATNNITHTSNKFNSSSSARTESNDLLLDSLEESMYSEVAALISVNEQRPSYLLQLFKDLKQINSDHDRQAALLTIHNLATKSLVTANVANFTQSAVSQNHNEEQQSINNERDVTCKDKDSDSGYHNNIPERLNVSNANDNVMARTAADDGRHRTSRRQQQQHQPRNISWRCPKESVALASTSILPSNCRKLDWEVRSILVDMLPFLKSHLSENCTVSLLESVRRLILQLVPSPQNIPGQLDALLEDALFKFQGCRMYDVCDELISVVADVLINELTFLRLTTSVNSSAPDVRNQSDFCAVGDEEEVVLTVEEEEEEEGAFGGVDQSLDNNPVKSHLSNRRQHASASEVSGCSTKSDPVISDAELAEADQSGRHSESITAAIGLPVTTNSATIRDAERSTSRPTNDNTEQDGQAEVVDNVIFSSVTGSGSESKIMSPAIYENGCCSNNAEGSTQQLQLRKIISSGNNPLFPSPGVARLIVDQWAVEEDREQQAGHEPMCLNVMNGTGVDSECEQFCNNPNNDVAANDISLRSNSNINNSDRSDLGVV